MSGGKDAALDLRYGRQGGRRSHASGRAEQVLAEIDRMRQRGLADGTWPVSGRSIDPEKCTICGVPRRDHGAPCRYCGRAPEHHAEGDLDAERAGKRRMAEARRVAGSSLNELDLDVLGRPTERTA